LSKERAPALPNWSRPLPRPLKIPTVMTLKTLADVRELIKHVPKERRQFSTWRTVEKALDEAAAGADLIGVSIVLRLVLSVEDVECRPA
jgi:hypothetical protein